MFGLKGRFHQPRPKAWDNWRSQTSTLKGSFGLACGRHQGNGPFRAEFPLVPNPRPSAWANRIGLSGRKCLEKSFTALPFRLACVQDPGRCPGLIYFGLSGHFHCQARFCRALFSSIRAIGAIRGRFHLPPIGKSPISVVPPALTVTSSPFLPLAPRR